MLKKPISFIAHNDKPHALVVAHVRREVEIGGRKLNKSV